MRDYPGIVIPFLYFLSILQQGVIIVLTPSKSSNLELFNETMISFYLVATIVMTDYASGDESKVISGYLIIGVIGLTVLINFSSIIYSLFLKLLATRRCWTTQYQTSKDLKISKGPFESIKTKEVAAGRVNEKSNT